MVVMVSIAAAVEVAAATTIVVLRIILRKYKGKSSVAIIYSELSEIMFSAIK